VPVFELTILAPLLDLRLILSRPMPAFVESRLRSRRTRCNFTGRGDKGNLS
jgi:hypothetical protein